MNKEKSFTLHEQPEIDQPDQPESDGMLQNIVGKSLFRKYIYELENILYLIV